MTGQFQEYAADLPQLRKKPECVTGAQSVPANPESINTIIAGRKLCGNAQVREYKKVGVAHLGPWRLAHLGGVSC
jgi:hypothetical protein